MSFDTFLEDNEYEGGIDLDDLESAWNAAIKEQQVTIDTAIQRLTLVSESEVGAISWDCICNAIEILKVNKRGEVNE